MIRPLRYPQFSLRCYCVTVKYTFVNETFEYHFAVLLSNELRTLKIAVPADNNLL